MVFKESDEQKLTELVYAAESAIVLRLQELNNSRDDPEERIEIKRAVADLLVIKTHKLGWPAIPTTSNPMA
jgi:hypothetical protein